MTTIPKDPLAENEKGPLWENDPTFAVVALLQHSPTSRTIVSTVRLAKTWDQAQEELKRMIDVVTDVFVHSKPFADKRDSYTIERGRSYARVEFAKGITYSFSIKKSSWAKRKGAASVIEPVVFTEEPNMEKIAGGGCGNDHPHDSAHGCGRP